MVFFEFVKKYAGFLLMASIVLGYLFPGMAIFKPLLSWLLITMLFVSLLNIDLKWHKFFRPGLLLYGLFSWIVAPLLILLISKGLIIEYRIGLLLAVITPAALGSPVIISLLDGDLEFILTQVIFYNILAPVTFAFLPLIYFRGTQMTIPVEGILLNVAKIIFIPLLLSQLVKRKEKLRDGIVNSLGKFVPLMVIFLVLVVVASASDQIRNTKPGTIITIFSITLGITGFLYSTGYFLGKRKLKNIQSEGECLGKKLLDKTHWERTLSVALGHKNTGLAIIVCLNSFSPIVALPSIFYIISHHIMNAIMLQIYSRSRSTK